MSIETVTPSAMLPARRTGFRGVGERRGFVQFAADLAQYESDCWFDRGAIHEGLHLRPHTRSEGERSRAESRAILWRCSRSTEHLVIGSTGAAGHERAATLYAQANLRWPEPAFHSC